jgi:undecaprenyl diphosphate synthase
MSYVIDKNNIFNKINNYNFVNLSSSLADIFEIDKDEINKLIYNLYKSNIEIINKNENKILNTKIIIVNTGLYYLNLLNNTTLNQNTLLFIILSILYFEKNYYLLNQTHFEIVKLILQNKYYKPKNKLEYYIVNFTKIFFIKKYYIINKNININKILEYTDYQECIKMILTPEFNLFNTITLELLQIIYLYISVNENNIPFIISKINIFIKHLKIETDLSIKIISLIEFILHYALDYLISKYSNNHTNNTFNLITNKINNYCIKYFDFYKDLIISTTKYNINNIPHSPLHIGVILDGNRRYSKKYNLNYEIGYLNGAKTAKQLIDWCINLQYINMVTLYVFSIDNYTKRNDAEKTIIYSIISSYYEDLLPFFTYNNIKVNCIGNLNIFPTKLQTCFKYISTHTENNTGLILNLAIGYDGQYEIINAINKAKLHDINTPDDLTPYMELKNNIDLVIRTGGMKRSSNFFIWQTSYSEWYFLDKYWPEFTYNDLTNIISQYHNTPHNYGK